MDTSGLLRQCLLVTKSGLASIHHRWASSLTVLIGTAGVVGVFVSVLSIASGYQQAMKVTGSEENVMIFAAGAESELASSISSRSVRVIENIAGIAASDDGSRMVSGEVYVITNREIVDSGRIANIAVRGVTDTTAFAMRPKMEIVEGRRFSPGRHEVIVGRGLQDRFDNLEVGSTISIGSGEWDIVGAFVADGGVVESEVWGDASLIQAQFGRQRMYQVVYARLQQTETIDSFGTRLEKDPRLNVDVRKETEYYSSQADALSAFVKVIGYTVGVLMSCGAIFSSIMTSYSSVVSRRREIGIFGALGFREEAVLCSVVSEALILTLLGAGVGAAVAYLVFDGLTTSTLFFSGNFSQVVFTFDVGAPILLQAVAAAALIGICGGLYPAIRAVRTPISELVADRR